MKDNNNVYERAKALVNEKQGSTSTQGSVYERAKALIPKSEEVGQFLDDLGTRIGTNAETLQSAIAHKDYEKAKAGTKKMLEESTLNTKPYATSEDAQKEELQGFMDEKANEARARGMKDYLDSTIGAWSEGRVGRAGQELIDSASKPVVDIMTLTTPYNGEKINVADMSFKGLPNTAKAEASKIVKDYLAENPHMEANKEMLENYVAGNIYNDTFKWKLENDEQFFADAFEATHGIKYKDFLKERVNEIKGIIKDLRDEAGDVAYDVSHNRAINDLMSDNRGELRVPALEGFMGETLAEKPYEEMLDKLNDWEKNSFASGFAAGFDWSDFFSLGLADMISTAEMGNVLEKANRGDKLYGNEVRLLELAKLIQELESYRDKVYESQGLGSKIGGGIGTTVEMLPEFALAMTGTGAVGSFAKLGGKAALKAALKAGGKELFKYGVKTTGKLGYNFGLAKVRGLAAAPFMPSTYNTYLDNLNSAYSFDDEGNLSYTPVNKKQAALGAVFSTANEISSEYLGAGIGKVVGWGARGLGRMVAGTKLAEAAVGVGKKARKHLPKFTPQAKVAMRTLGVQADPVSETLSEALGDIMTSYEQTWIGMDVDKSQYGTMDYWMTLAGVTLVYGGSMAALGAAQSYRDVKKAVKVREDILAQITDRNLHDTLVAISTSDDVVMASAALADMNWDAFGEEAHLARAYVAADLNVKILEGAVEEESRLDRFRGTIEGVRNIVYQGKAGEYSDIIREAEMDGKKVYIINGYEANTNQYIVVDAVTGEKTSVDKSKVTPTRELDVDTYIQEAYQNTFSLEAEKQRVADVKAKALQLDNPTEKDVKRIASTLNIALPKVGNTVMLANGNMGAVTEVLSPTEYAVQDPSGATYKVHFTDILSTDKLTATAQGALVRGEVAAPIAPVEETTQPTEVAETTTEVAETTTPDDNGITIGAEVTVDGRVGKVRARTQDGKYAVAFEAESGNYEDTEMEFFTGEELASLMGVAPMPTTEAPKTPETTTEVATTENGSVDVEQMSAEDAAKALIQRAGTIEEAIAQVKQVIEAVTEERKKTAKAEKKTSLNDIGKKSAELQVLDTRLEFYGEVLGVLEGMLAEQQKQTMTEAQNIAEEAGVAPEATNTTDTTTEQSKPVEQPTSGLIRNGAEMKFTDNVIKMVDFVAKRLGITVEFVDGLKNEAGQPINGDITGKRVRISTSGTKGIKFIMGHEFFHRMKDLVDEQTYADFLYSIKEYAGEKVWNATMAHQRNVYRNHNARVAKEAMAKMSIDDVAKIAAYLNINIEGLSLEDAKTAVARGAAMGKEQGVAEVDAIFPKMLSYDDALMVEECAADVAGTLVTNTNAFAKYVEDNSSNIPLVRGIRKAIRAMREFFDSFGYTDQQRKFNALEQSLAGVLNEAAKKEEKAEKKSATEGKTRNSLPSLVGVHNISLDKLRKVIKMGGLANPSVAVIDVDKQTHDDYGEYSLVLPKNMVDARQGKNAGTWAGDAWTPTYPQVIKRMKDDKSYSRFHKDIEALPEAMRNKVRLEFDSFMEGRSADPLAYWYLFEKGTAPELVLVPSRYSDEVANAISEATKGSFSMYGLTPEERAKCLEVYIAVKFNGDKTAFENDLQERIARLTETIETKKSDRVKKWAQSNIDAIKEYGFDYDSVADFIRDVQYDVREKGTVNVDATIMAAREQIKANNLETDYEAWLNGLEERYGIEEYIFDGYTNSGNRRYLPHTVENASKWMNKQGRQGAVATFPSFGTFVAVSIPKMTTLESIRKRKALLGKSKEEYDAFREKWENVYYELGKKLQPDAKGFDDYGYWRLIEAVGHNNPKEFIKKQYNIELSEEDMAKFNDMVNAIRTEYPARYFETKFERPLQLSDFTAAVVPNDIPLDVESRLKDAGVEVIEYEKGDKASRAEAMQKASAMEGIRFSLQETNDRFNAELAMQISGTLPKGHIYKLGMPSYILRDAGIPNLPIELAASRLVDKSMQENHPFDLDEVKDLPFAIHLPLAVFRSATHIGSNVILTELKHNGKSFVVAIETNRQAGKLFVNSIRSVHYRTDMNIINWINDGLADYIKPTFEQEWLVPTKNKLLSQPQYNSVDVRKKLNDVTNVIQNFENPKISAKYSLQTPTFYSNAEFAVRGIKQEKATPEQWLKMIEKAGGLKAGEDKWLGLSGWLKASDKKTLTKDEVLQYIADNNFVIEEVEYSDVERFTDRDIYDTDEFTDLLSSLQIYDEDDNASFNIEEYNRLRESNADFEEGFSLDYWGESLDVKDPVAAARYLGLTEGKAIHGTRLGYTTAGLENKREIALVVPSIEPYNQRDEIHFGDAGEGRAVAWIRFGETEAPKNVPMHQRVEEFDEPFETATGLNFYAPKNGNGKFAKDYVLFGKLKDGSEGYIIYIDRKPISKHDTLEDARNAMNEYYEANPRMITRYERVLVIDEIQSKRHQDGREKGYSDKRVTQQELHDAQEAAFEAVMEQERALADKYGEDEWASLATAEEMAEYERLRALDEAATNAYENYDKGVPSAPFEKNWAELAMKRMLRYAAENGFDKVAWTTGDQQADRYNMAKVLESISRKDFPFMSERTFVLDGNKYDTLTIDENGNVISFNTTIAEAIGKPLTDVVGKDMAEKMMSLEDGDTISGDGLRIGGEGMKGFYDQMLPSFMNKYGKKWGVKVGEVTMPNLEENNTMHAVDVTDSMRESVMQGQPRFSLPTDLLTDFADEFKALQDEYASLDPATIDYKHPFRVHKREVVQKYVDHVVDVLGLSCETFVIDAEDDAQVAEAYDRYKKSHQLVSQQYPHRAAPLADLNDFKSGLKDDNGKYATGLYYKGTDFILMIISENDGYNEQNGYLQVNIHENVHGAMDTLGITDFEKEMVLSEAEKYQSNTLKKYLDGYDNETDAAKGEEIVAYAINSRLNPTHGKLLLEFFEGGVTLSDIWKSYNLQLPLRLSLTRKILNYLKDGYEAKNKITNNAGGSNKTAAGSSPKATNSKRFASKYLGEDIRVAERWDRSVDARFHLPDPDPNDVFYDEIPIFDEQGNEVDITTLTSEEAKEILDGKVRQMLEAEYDHAVVAIRREAEEARQAVKEVYRAEKEKRRKGAKAARTNAARIDEIFGDTPFESLPYEVQALILIATGQAKIYWGDRGNKRGLASELGLTGSTGDRHAYRNIWGGAKKSFNEVVHDWWESLGGQERGIDDQDLRNALISALQSVQSSRDAMQEIINKYDDLAEDRDNTLAEIDRNEEKELYEAKSAYEQHLANFELSEGEERTAYHDRAAQFFGNQSLSRVDDILEDLTNELERSKRKIERLKAEKKDVYTPLAESIQHAKDTVLRALERLRMFAGMEEVDLNDVARLINLVKASRSQRQIENLGAQATALVQRVSIKKAKTNLMRLLSLKLSNTDIIHKMLKESDTWTKEEREAILKHLWKVSRNGLRVSKAVHKDTKEIVDELKSLVDAFRKNDLKGLNDAQKTKIIEAKLAEMEKELHPEVVYDDKGNVQDNANLPTDFNAENKHLAKFFFKSYLEMLAKEVEYHNTVDELREKIDNKEKTDGANAALVVARENYLNALNQFNSSLESLILEGKGKLRDWNAQKEQHEIEIRSMGIRAIGGKKASGQGKASSKMARARATLNISVNAPYWTFETVLEKIDHNSPYKKGKLYTYFMDKWADANDDLINRYAAHMEEIAEVMRKCFPDDAKNILKLKRNPYALYQYIMRKAESTPIGTLTYKEMGEDGQMRDAQIVLNVANAMYVIAMWRQPRYQEAMQEKHAITQGDIDALMANIASVNAGFLDFMDWVNETFLPSTRLEYDVVYRKMNGGSMPKEINYFPARVAGHKEVDLANIDNGALPTTPSALKDRMSAHIMPQLGMDYFKVLESHIQDMDNWAAYAELTADLNVLLSSDEFRRRCNDYMGGLGGDGGGKGSLYDLFKQTSLIATGMYRGEAGLNQLLGQLQKAWATSNIAFRYWTAVKQISSITTGMFDNLRFYKHAGIAATGVGIYHEIKNAMEISPSLRYRWKSGAAGMEALARETQREDGYTVQRGAYEKGKDFIGDAIKTLVRAGMTPNAAVDLLACSIIVNSVYETEIARLTGGKREATEEEKRAAVRKAERAFNTTQQSSEGAYLAPVQANPAYGVLTTYMNASFALHRKRMGGIKELWKLMTSKQYRRYLKDEFGVDAAKISAKDAFKDILSGVVGELSFAMMGWGLMEIMALVNGWLNDDDDDEDVAAAKQEVFDKWWKPILPMLNGYLFGSAATSWASGFGTSLTPAYDEFVKDVKGIFDDSGNRTWEVAQMAAKYLVGIDLKALQNIGAGLEAMFEDDERAGAVLKFLNAPSRYIKAFVGDRREGETLEEYQTRIIRFHSLLEDVVYEHYFDEEGNYIGEDAPSLSMSKNQAKALRKEYEAAYAKNVLYHYGGEEALAGYLKVEKQHKDICDLLGWSSTAKVSDKKRDLTDMHYALAKYQDKAAYWEKKRKDWVGSEDYYYDLLMDEQEAKNDLINNYYEYIKQAGLGAY